MEKLPVYWNEQESQENFLRFGVSFKEAKEVVCNMSSFHIQNIEKDYTFIGPMNDLSKILIVNCKKEDGFRKIYWARKASINEEKVYFNHLATGVLK